MENLLIELNNLTGWNISHDQSQEDIIWEVSRQWENDQAFGEWTVEVRKLVEAIKAHDPEENDMASGMQHHQD